ncbi:uncharacterized protein LOC113313955 isoform X2 [Papaver somniferum]|uniref:uncharacterized protein LOC113313955 isoform X2 n=1 Tax=Papaver somniferum TaxID=3469 RepID=UPI000E6FDBCF|nr:uncharacterized protein LOC113313955 isoform X2 [Papaver somniferum]
MVRIVRKLQSMNFTRSFSTEKSKPVFYTRWPIPPMNILKFNTDASVKGHESKCAFVARVHGGKYADGIMGGKSSLGKWVIGGFRPLDNNTSIVASKIHGILYAMEAGGKIIEKLPQPLHLWIESDEKAVVGAANGENDIKSEYRDMVNEIVHKKEELEKNNIVCLFSFIKGEANGVAHLLARLDSKKVLDMPTVEDVPEDIRDEVVKVLESDSMGTKYQIKRR